MCLEKTRKSASLRNSGSGAYVDINLERIGDSWQITKYDESVIRN